MKRGVIIAGAVTVAVAGGTAAFMAGGSADEPPAKPKSTASAAIERGDLVDTESVDGTLTYGEERNVTAGAQGTVTWAPGEGAVVRRGKSLLKIDGKPVTLMYGQVPMYRALKQGDKGKDVKQLERNLVALGYGSGMTVDEKFSAATASAVKKWQEDRGLTETGSVDQSQIVFQPGAVRVKQVKTASGARAPGSMTLTGTTRTVHVDLDASKQDLARKGAQVSVELPGGKTVKGKISSVGSVAEKQPNSDTTTVGVEISLGKADTGRLDQAPVTVSLASETRKGVLSVPVEALLALSEGGFGVEVVEGGTSRLVAVETGTFGGGRVEISGQGLKEGMKVGVPES